MGLEFDGVNGIIKNSTSDGDVTIKGNDGGSEISLLAFDVSAEGVATFNKDVKLGDSGKAIFGAGSDLQIYHDGTNSYISDQGTNDLKILATDFQLKNAADNEFMMTAVTDGAVTLYHNNVIKIATTSAGVDITGGFNATVGSTITTADNTDTLTLVSTDADASVGPNLRLYRNSGSPADDDATGAINFIGRNDNSQDVTYASIRSFAVDVSDGSEDGMFVISVPLNGTSKDFVKIGLSETVFNEDSADLNFRVESDGNANMLFVDGGNNRVGIGTGSPEGLLHLLASSGDASLTIETSQDSGAAEPSINLKAYATNANPIINFGDRVGYPGFIEYENSDDSMRLGTNGSERMRILSGGQVIINSTSQKADELFSVATGANSRLVYIDSSAGSYSQELIKGDVNRAASADYGFLRFTSGGEADTEFQFSGIGTATADGSFSGGGADYAEFFEWKDGNSSDEDRRGFSVVLDGNKIVKATDSDDTSKIIGVISANPAVVGDSDIERWKQKHLTDDYGSYIYEDYTQTEWKETIIIDGKEDIKEHSYQTDLIPDGLAVPDDAIVTVKDDNGDNLQRRKVNPDWNKDTAYISREDRKEWDTVGLMGKLRLKKGQPTGTNWIKMRDISDTVEEWLVR